MKPFNFVFHLWYKSTNRVIFHILTKKWKMSRVFIIKGRAFVINNVYTIEDLYE